MYFGIRYRSITFNGSQRVTGNEILKFVLQYEFHSFYIDAEGEDVTISAPRI